MAYHDLFPGLSAHLAQALDRFKQDLGALDTWCPQCFDNGGDFTIIDDAPGTIVCTSCGRDWSPQPPRCAACRTETTECKVNRADDCDDGPLAWQNATDADADATNTMKCSVCSKTFALLKPCCAPCRAAEAEDAAEADRIEAEARAARAARAAAGTPPLRPRGWY